MDNHKEIWEKERFFRYVVSSMTTILLIFIPFFFVIFTYYKYVLTQELSKQATINALQSKNIFESLTEDFHTGYELARNSQDVRDFLHSPIQNSGTETKTREFIRTLLQDSSLPEEIFIYSFANETCVSSRETKHLGTDNLYEWYRTYRSTKLPFIMFPRTDETGRFTKLYICNEIYENNKLKGLYCTEMNYQKFVSIIQDSFVSRPDQIFVVSDIGLILYCDNPDLINTQMFEKKDTYAAFRSATNVEGNSIIYDDYIIAVAKKHPVPPPNHVLYPERQHPGKLQIRQCTPLKQRHRHFCFLHTPRPLFLLPPIPIRGGRDENTGKTRYPEQK